MTPRLGAVLLGALFLATVVAAVSAAPSAPGAPGPVHAAGPVRAPTPASDDVAADTTPTPTPTATPTAIPTPPPTPTPVLVSGLYRNAEDGYSFTAPDGWAFLETGAKTPALTLEEPGGPDLVVDVWVFRLTETQPVDDWLMGLVAGFGDVAVVSESEVETGGGDPGYRAELAYNLAGLVDIREVWLGVVRGTRAFLLRSSVTASEYDEFAADIDAFNAGFTIEAPAPFGASQDDSLFQLWGHILTLDPALYRGSPAGIPGAIFGGLVMLNRDLEVEPDLAESWDIGPDGTVYTFFLRPDAVFHDGRPVTAHDFVYSWERAADPALESPTARTYLGDIVGVKAKLDGEATDISGLTALDDLTLEVTIDAPRSYFIQKLVYPTAYVVDRNNVETGDDWTDAPNGTGPFKLKVWQKDELLVLERNERYHRGVPQLKHSVYRLFAGSSMTMYEQGEIDTAGVSIFDIERVLDPDNALSRDLLVGTTLCTSYVEFNVAIPPFDDPLVRQAFALALDIDKELAVTLKGSAERAGGILPPGMPGYNPALTPTPFDPDRARALLDESSYGGAENLPPIVSFAGDGAMHWSWREYLGVEVEAVSLPEPQDWFDRRDAEEIPLGVSGWCADYPDPQNFLEVLFHSESDENHLSYANPEVDALLDQAGFEPDHETRMALYQEAEQLILADWVIVPIWHHQDYALVRPYVKGYELTPIGISILQDLWIER